MLCRVHTRLRLGPRGLAPVGAAPSPVRQSDHSPWRCALVLRGPGQERALTQQLERFSSEAVDVHQGQERPGRPVRTPLKKTWLPESMR